MDKTQLKQILKDHFGFDDFRPGQSEVLMALLDHQNTLAVLPTGAGKTLIYQMFGLLNPQPIIIISPLLSLMQDQADRLKYLGIKKVVALNSTLDWQQKQFALHHLNQYQYIYVSPETISQLEVMRFMKNIHPGLVVIDEAHCLSQWGPDFRPEYLNLKTILNGWGHPLTLMLTATASKEIQADIINKLGLMDSVHRVIESVDRPNIYLSVRRVLNADDKIAALVSMVNQIQPPGIIYFLSRKLANQVALTLNHECNLRVAAYHSGLLDEERFKIQHQFMNDQLDVICATSAFGMGVDKNNVRFVIHYHLPVDLESYMQEIGRAGRDNKQSIAILLYQNGDESLPASFIDNNIPNQQTINSFFNDPQRIINLAPNDEQVRILSFYWQHGYSRDLVNNIFSARYKQQKNNLNALMRYVTFDGCRRQFLLNYFNQIAPPHSRKCCDYLAPQNPIAELGLKRTSSNGEKANDLDWRLIIEKLFKNDD